MTCDPENARLHAARHLAGRAKRRYLRKLRKQRGRCPTKCLCVCHDTGGSGHDHEGRPCPGKENDR